tara:strand:- start:632 stop:1162 length:531 start_codon:yes stop_codon:yes gene_type:complete
MLTDREKQYCADISERFSSMRRFLSACELSEPVDPIQWHSFLSGFRKIQGNLNNDGSFVATLLAKYYLSSKYDIEFDAAEKPQGAPGIDIQVETSNGTSIAAEIKTTVPYQATDFGAQQAASFKKDFAKLTVSDATYKYLLVTDAHAFEVLQKDKYRKLMHGITVVNLVSGDEFAA